MNNKKIHPQGICLFTFEMTRLDWAKPTPPEVQMSKKGNAKALPLFAWYNFPDKFLSKIKPLF